MELFEETAASQHFWSLYSRPSSKFRERQWKILLHPCTKTTLSQRSQNDMDIHDCGL